MNNKKIAVVGILAVYAAGIAGELHERYQSAAHETDTLYGPLRLPAPVDGHESTHASTRIAEPWTVQQVTTSVARLTTSS